MLPRRGLLRLGCGAPIAILASSCPLALTVGLFSVPAIDAAQAKDGNNGNGNGSGGSSNNGNGSGNGNGNGSGSGNAAGNGGNSSSNAGGNGKGNRNGGVNAIGNSASPGSSSPSSTSASPASGVQTSGSDGVVNVRHRNGITETLRRGRYIMQDSKGRTIVDRQATGDDVRRLNQLVR